MQITVAWSRFAACTECATASMRFPASSARGGGEKGVRRKRCQEPFSHFLGRPRGRTVVSRPSRLTAWICRGRSRRSKPRASCTRTRLGSTSSRTAPRGKAREAERIFFAGEPVKPADPPPAPELTAAQMLDGYRIVDLDRLITMKLTAFRLKDRVHLLDMNDAGLIDAATLERVPPVLRPRLEDLLAYPEGGPSGISMGRRSCPCQSSGVGNRVEPRRRSEVSSE